MAKGKQKQIPTFKFQNPRKIQSPRIKLQTIRTGGSLEFDPSLNFEVWTLNFPARRFNS